jgi:hypothetical protein
MDNYIHQNDLLWYRIAANCAKGVKVSHKINKRRYDHLLRLKILNENMAVAAVKFDDMATFEMIYYIKKFNNWFPCIKQAAKSRNMKLFQFLLMWQYHFADMEFLAHKYGYPELIRWIRERGSYGTSFPSIKRVKNVEDARILIGQYRGNPDFHKYAVRKNNRVLIDFLINKGNISKVLSAAMLCQKRDLELFLHKNYTIPYNFILAHDAAVANRLDVYIKCENPTKGSFGNEFVQHGNLRAIKWMRKKSENSYPPDYLIYRRAVIFEQYKVIKWAHKSGIKFYADEITRIKSVKMINFLIELFGKSILDEIKIKKTLLRNIPQWALDNDIRLECLIPVGSNDSNY